MQGSSFLQGFTQEYLALLGKIIVGWSHLEQQFDLLYLSFVVMRGKKTGTLTDPKVNELMGASFKKRISNFRERLKELNMSNEKKSEVDSILDKLSSLRNERDKVAHSVWMPVFEDDQIALGKGSSLFKSWKNSKEHESSVVSEDKLGKIFDRIHELFWEIVNLSLDQEFRNANIAT